MKIYINGVQDTNTAVAPSGGIYVSNYPLHIGTWMHSSGTPDVGFVGLIDEFKLFNTAISPSPVLTSITLSPTQATLQVSKSQVFTTKALDQNGLPMSNVAITFVHAPDNSTGSMQPVTTTTDVNGNATSTFTAIAPGTSTLQAMRPDGSVESNISSITVQSTGLVLNLSFDETGNIAYDTSGNGNNGTIYNGVRVSGISGSALSFRSGAISYVEVPKSASLDSISTNKQITIDVWINSPLGVRGTIAERWLYSPTASRSYVLVLESNGSITFLLSSNGVYPASGTGVLISNSKVIANQWTHIVATSDGTTMKIYFNGVQDTNTAVAPSGGIFIPNAPLHIGTWMYSAGTPAVGFVGLIDEFKLFNIALVPTLISVSQSRLVPRSLRYR
jgi:hypothetical protein